MDLHSIWLIPPLESDAVKALWVGAWIFKALGTCDRELVTSKHAPIRQANKSSYARMMKSLAAVKRAGIKEDEVWRETLKT